MIFFNKKQQQKLGSLTQSRCIRYLLAAESHCDGLNRLLKIHFVGLVAVLIVET